MCCQLVTTFKMNFLVAIASYLFMSCVNINLNLLTNELDGIKKIDFVQQGSQCDHKCLVDITEKNSAMNTRQFVSHQITFSRTS